MQCYNCDQSNWHELPHLNSERLLQVCKTCGTACYRVEPEEEKKMFDYYRHEYRPQPTVANLITSSHKQHYIEAFLAEFLKGKKGLLCVDIGSAIGYIPNTLRRAGHKATGCELTVTYRRFAEHFYGIPMTETPDETKQYDLITLYHVFEHLIQPHEKLAKYAQILKEDGRMMISTPEWLDTLEEASGAPITTFQHLFHKDHINVFTRQSLVNLFAKAGLVIEKEDHITYGQTYLLRKKKADEKGLDFVNEDWKAVVEKIERQARAIAALRQGQVDQSTKREGGAKFQEAIELWPKFPDAWLQSIFGPNTSKNPEQQQALFNDGFKLMPDNSRMRLAYGVWLFQNQRTKEALEQFTWLMKHRPSEDILIYMGWSFELLGQKREAMSAFAQAADMNPMKWAEAYNHMCKNASELPAWDEVAEQEVKNALFKQAQPKFTRVDPVMDEVAKPKPDLSVVQ